MGELGWYPVEIVYDDGDWNFAVVSVVAVL